GGRGGVRGGGGGARGGGAWGAPWGGGRARGAAGDSRTAAQVAEASITRAGTGRARRTSIPVTPETSDPTSTPSRAWFSSCGSPPKARVAMNSATVNPIPATIATP